jgi:serine/threonine protein kinase
MAADGTLKITDFGLAVMQDSVMQFSETDPGGGTARWMVRLALSGVFGRSLEFSVQAPELFKENAKRSFETDVYALGMVSLIATLSINDHSLAMLCSRRCWCVAALSLASSS